MVKKYFKLISIRYCNFQKNKICRLNIFNTYFGKDGFYPIDSDEKNYHEFQA